MSASFFRGHFLRLTASQLRFKHAYRSVSIPSRSFSASPALYEKEPQVKTASDLAGLHEALDAADSNISRHGLEVGAQENEISLNATHLVTHKLDQNRSGTFWVNYRRFEGGKGDLLDAVARKEILRRLIRLATTQDEWDALKRIFKIWKQNQWGMESVAETALYARATEHFQFALLIHLIKEEAIDLPSRRQARQATRAIVAPRWGRQPPLIDCLVQLINFDDVNSDPRISKGRRSQDRFRSVAATDDIVIGTMMLSVLLQSAGEPTFDTSSRRRLSKKALQLASSLAKWRMKGLDGSGGNAISLAQDEKGWAYVATLDCSAALEFPSVVEILKSVWLENVEVTLTREMWVRQGGLGARANKDWLTHLGDLKEWIKEANLIFEER